MPVSLATLSDLFLNKINLLFYLKHIRDPDNEQSSHWILVGIVSFGFGCARPGELGGYTRITYFLDWVNGVIGKFET